MAATVTIDRAYFETLLRRAEFHSSGKDLSTPLDLPMVTIPKVDHDGLLRIAQEYGEPTSSLQILEFSCAISAAYCGVALELIATAALRTALFQGGINEETLAILINGGGGLRSSMEGDIDGEAIDGSSPRAEPARRWNELSGGISSQDTKFSRRNGYQTTRVGDQQRSYSYDESDFLPETENRENPHPLDFRPNKSRFTRPEQRTIRLKNLSDRVDHKDIANAVRGGQILDIYLRNGERSASVSFVDGAAAQAFFSHSRRQDIYLLGKRVEMSWNDRQFILPGHVAAKIQNGATRNLVIRNTQYGITEERIREDLDHIHNLVVVGLHFSDRDAYVSLNSVHNALYARTCMMSRASYKGSKIEFYPDECAQALPTISYSPKRDDAKLEKTKSAAMLNRFQLLDIDGTQDGSEEGSEESTIFPPSKVGQAWGPTPVAV